jgi:hypothetical protein
VRGEGGAALLEALIALALTALLAAAVASAAGLGLDAADRARETARASGTALIAERRLRGLIARLDPETGVAAGPARLVFRAVAEDADGVPQDRLRRLSSSRGRLILAACGGGDPVAPGPCAPAEDLGPAPTRPFTYADAAGAFAPNWDGPAPPSLIAVEVAGRRIVAAPRGAAP